MRLDIDPKSWAELNRLLDAALDLPLDDRARFVETLDQSFDALKPQLHELIAQAAEVETADFLRTLPRIESSVDDKAGQIVGTYRLLRELGSGGMGSVWLAERTDGILNRPVALKLPHIVGLRKGLVERLAREREILAALRHPNIATLYDAGVSDDGQPFLALEYIEGQPIDSYARAKDLGIEALLKLFVQAAKAVAFAHAKLIVHRDLKPSNILVTADGQVRLLDFGIAKLLAEGEIHRTQLTEVSGRAFTPEYASPEQILGQPITTASDTYSLGVILYQLLAGQRPYSLKRESRGALEDAIVQSDPKLPSDVNSSRRKELRGDLDTIVLKALKKNPDDRYGTVNAMVDDIFRYLDGRPVLAQPDSRWYAAKKFLRRNRLAVGAGATVAIALIVGALLALWQAQTAITERQRVERVREFIAGVFIDSDPFQQKGSPATTAVELLDRARIRVEADRTLDSVSRVELLNLLAHSYWGMADYPKAEALARKVVEIGEQDSSISRYQVERARTVSIDALQSMGKFSEAHAALDQLLASLQADETPNVESLAGAKLMEVTLEQNEGRLGSDKAFAAANEALNLAGRLPQPNSTALRAHQSLGAIYRIRNETDKARDHAGLAFELAKALFKDSGNPRLVLAQNEFGRAQQATGDLRGAVSNLRAAQESGQAAFANNPAVLQHLQGTLAVAELEFGEIKGALERLRVATSVDVGQTKLSPVYLASQKGAIGRALLMARQPQEAAKTFDQAIAHLGADAGKSNIPAQIRQEHALANGLLGEFDLARASLTASMEANKGPPENNHVALRYLATIERLAGNADEARSRIDEALRMATAITAKPNVRTSTRLQHADALVESGLISLEASQASRALPEFEAAIRRYGEIQESITPSRADALVGIGRAYLALGRPTDALQALEQADRFWKGFDAGNPWAGETSFWLSRAYEKNGRMDDARKALANATHRLRASPLASHRALVTKQ